MSIIEQITAQTVWQHCNSTQLTYCLFPLSNYDSFGKGSRMSCHSVRLRATISYCAGFEVRTDLNKSVDKWPSAIRWEILLLTCCNSDITKQSFSFII